MRSLSLADRPLIAGRAFWFYLGKLLWPAPLMPYYPRWHIDARAAWQYLFPLSAAALVAALWSCRGRLGSGPLVAVLFFVIMLAPVLGLVNFNFMTFAYVADHFQYLPSIGPIALGAAAMVTINRTAGLPRLVAPLTAAALLMLLGTLTWRQAGTYRDEETQMRDCLAKNPAAAGAHYNLGTVMLGQGRLDAALSQLVAALRDKPDYADAHNNVGVILLRQGNVEEAMSHFTEAARLQPFDYRPQENLGAALERLGREDEAIVHYAAAVAINPQAAESQRELGRLLLEQHQPDAAAPHFAAALQLRPDDTDDPPAAWRRRCRCKARPTPRWTSMPSCCRRRRRTSRCKPRSPRTWFSTAVWRNRWRTSRWRRACSRMRPMSTTTGAPPWADSDASTKRSRNSRRPCGSTRTTPTRRRISRRPWRNRRTTGAVKVVRLGHSGAGVCTTPGAAGRTSACSSGCSAGSVDGSRNSCSMRARSAAFGGWPACARARSSSAAW